MRCKHRGNQVLGQVDKKPGCGLCGGPKTALQPCEHPQNQTGLCTLEESAVAQYWCCRTCPHIEDPTIILEIVSASGNEIRLPESEVRRRRRAYPNPVLERSP